MVRINLSNKKVIRQQARMIAVRKEKKNHQRRRSRLKKNKRNNKVEH